MPNPYNALTTEALPFDPEERRPSTALAYLQTPEAERLARRAARAWMVNDVAADAIADAVVMALRGGAREWRP